MNVSKVGWKLPPSLTTVTPLSKALAAILFITFPFIGFYLGQQYRTPELESTPTPASDPRQPSPTITGRPERDLIFSLPFKPYTVELRRSGLPAVLPRYWSEEIFPSDLVLDESNPLSEAQPLYGRPGLGFFHVLANDKFYFLESGGHKRFSLISKSDIDQKITTTTTSSEYTYAQTTVVTTTTCELNRYPVGDIKALAVLCTTIASDNRDVHDESYTNNCYLPIYDGRYLAIEQQLKPMGPADTCADLVRAGVRDLTVKTANPE